MEGNAKLPIETRKKALVVNLQETLILITDGNLNFSTSFALLLWSTVYIYIYRKEPFLPFLFEY